MSFSEEIPEVRGVVLSRSLSLLRRNGRKRDGVGRVFVCVLIIPLIPFSAHFA